MASRREGLLAERFYHETHAICVRAPERPPLVATLLQPLLLLPGGRVERDLQQLVD